MRMRGGGEGGGKEKGGEGEEEERRKRGRRKRGGREEEGREEEGRGRIRGRTNQPTRKWTLQTQVVNVLHTVSLL